MLTENVLAVNFPEAFPQERNSQEDKIKEFIKHLQHALGPSAWRINNKVFIKQVTAFTAVNPAALAGAQRCPTLQSPWPTAHPMGPNANARALVGAQPVRGVLQSPLPQAVNNNSCQWNGAAAPNSHGQAGLPFNSGNGYNGDMGGGPRRMDDYSKVYEEKTVNI